MGKWDLIILGVITFFGLIGLIRGFITELFEAIGLICAIMFARQFALVVAPSLPAALPDYMRVPITSFVFSILIIFVIKAIGGMISKPIKKSPLKPLNTFMGLFAGAGKGLVLVVITLAIVSLTPVSRVLATAPPTPVLRWSLAASKPVMGYFGGRVQQTAQQELQDLTKKAFTEPLGSRGGVVATTVDSPPSDAAQALPPITPEERKAIDKLLKDPAIKSLNLSEQDLRNLVSKLNEAQKSAAKKH